MDGEGASAPQQPWQAPGALVQPLPSLHGAGPGQVAGMGQAPPPVQRASQAQELPQSMPLPHADDPPQVTSQSPAPQMMAPPQALDWLQVILHALAPEQLTPPPQAERPQETSHGMPAGQMTCGPQADSPLQSITQVLPVQRVHWGGQTKASALVASKADASALVPPSPAAGSTQKPSVQTRPSWQSAGTVQEKSGERRSKLHPAAAAASATSNATPRAVIAM
jgi:hypothetical protein